MFFLPIIYNSQIKPLQGKTFRIDCNNVFQVGLGWMGDLPWVNVTKTYAICLVLCGVSIILFPILMHALDAKQAYSFYILATNAVIFGLMFSSSYSYTPSILVELIALERFTTAYGLVLLSQGFGHLIGPPIAGKLENY